MLAQEESVKVAGRIHEASGHILGILVHGGVRLACLYPKLDIGTQGKRHPMAGGQCHGVGKGGKQRSDRRRRGES